MTIAKGATFEILQEAAELSDVTFIRVKGSPETGWRFTLSDEAKSREFLGYLFDLMVRTGINIDQEEVS